MPAASQEVLEYVNSIKPGDRIKSISKADNCNLVPNLWYTVKEITTRPYNGNISFKEILITVHGSESLYCPFWFGICDTYCQKLLPDRYDFIQVKEAFIFNPKEVKVGDQLLLGTNPSDWDEYAGKWITVSGIMPSSITHDGYVRFTVEERPGRALHQSWFIKHKPKEVTPPEPPTINKESRIKRFANWALVEPVKKTLQYAVFASIVGGAYVAVTEPSFFLKLLPKINVKIEQ